MKSSGNTILVTGGGTGIGREYAHRWHDAGNVVIVAGRTMAHLEETAEGRDGLHPIALDIADEASIAPFAKDLVARFPGFNVLMNNAGIMPYEDISARRDLSDAQAVVAINLLGPIRLTDALVDHLAGTRDAAIINVSSGLAFVPLPKAATYSATKAAIHSYTISLRTALAGKVEVIELVPPAVQTELTPGQSERESYMPLAASIDESFAILRQDPTPAEICVERAKGFRHAEANGTFDEMLELLVSL